MNVFSLVATIALNSSEYEKKLSDAKSKLSSFGSSVGNTLSNIGNAVGQGISVIGKIGTVAVGAASTVATAFAGSAVKGYAEYEQLAGGVETLFGSSADTVKKYAENAYKTTGLTTNQYMSTVTSFAASLLQSTKGTTKKLSEEEIEIRQDALDKQYELTKKAADKEYNAQKKAYDKQYDALQKLLSKQYDMRKKELDKQYDAVSDSLDAEIDATEKAHEKTLNDAEKSYEANVAAYEKATEERIALIDREYKESIKLIDEEQYNRIKAIDDEIDALNAQTEAEQKAQEQAEREQKRAELQKAINTAESAEERQKAEEELAAYNAKIAQKDREAQRKEQIAALKDQKTAIKDEASARKEAAKEKRDSAVDAVKEESKQTLAAMKEAHKDEIAALKESQKAEIDALKASKKESLSVLKEAQSNELEALKDGQKEQLAAYKEAQNEQLEAFKEAQDEKLKELKKSLDKQKKAISESNADMSQEIVNTEEGVAKAAEIANIAMQDMADNMNKMGTPMESIQNAYQGFAKQNYTMLDNLKLGYGGTKSEMERLLKDAEKLTGVEYDISNLSDVYLAIHAIQGEMGISGRTAEEAAEIYKNTGRVVSEQLGTTALEAEHTISGSMAAAKSAWDNFIAGIANPDEDPNELFDEFLDTANIALQNILPIAERVFQSLAEMIPTIAPLISEYLPQLLNDLLPNIIDTAVPIIIALGDGLIQNAPLIADAAIEIVTTLLDKISEALENDSPELSKILSDISDGISGAFEWLSENGDTVVKVLEGILAGFIAFKSVMTITSIIGGVMKAISLFTNPVGWVILAITALVAIGVALYKNWDTIKEKAAELKEKIANAWNDLKAKTAEVWENIKAKIKEKWEAVKSTFANVGTWFKEKFEDAKNKILDAWGNIKEKFTEIWEKIKSAFDFKDALNWGKDLIDNFVGGIKDKWNDLKGTLGEFGSKIADFIGFSEPKEGPLSNFHTFAPDMMDLFAKGIKDNTDIVTDQLQKSFDFSDVMANQSVNVSGNGAGGNTSYGGITVNVYGAEGQNINELADAVSYRLAHLMNVAGAVYA